MLRMLRCKRGEERGIPFGTPEVSFSKFLKVDLDDKIWELQNLNIRNIFIVDDKEKYVIFSGFRSDKHEVITGKPVMEINRNIYYTIEPTIRIYNSANPKLVERSKNFFNL